MTFTKDPARGLAIGAGAVIIALTAAAFWLSYAHLAEVALAHGLGGAAERAWAWPATLDLFIVAGELLMLRAALAKRVDWWAIGLTTVGSVGSIVLNVAGVSGTRDPATVPLLDYVVAAVPPAAALLAFGALMRQVHQALAGHAAPVDDLRGTAEVTTEVPAEPMSECTVERLPDPVVSVIPTLPALPSQSLVWDDFTTSKVPAAVPAEARREVVTEVVTLTPTELRRRARRLHMQVVSEGGRGVTIDQLRVAFGLSRREATELRRDVVGGRS
ncbi:DUF2637 domain-containing protein [Streptomyces sp. NPDC088745]|uniref:DUF2637 domain-containing protein n=1 Tax=Streptomyces sp. NPDC088745 TaxID=3365884 RepID=UPI0038015D8E